MVSASLRDSEDMRLEALQALALLTTEAEPGFESLARMASRLCETPISLVTLVGRDEQVFKANIGLPGMTGTPRAISFCTQTILGDEPFIVPDAKADARFADNPLVVGPPFFRFYAGIPITLDGGLRIGALCVIDRKPRSLDDGQIAALCDLAAIAADIIERRRPGAAPGSNEARPGPPPASPPASPVVASAGDVLSGGEPLVRLFADRLPGLLAYWDRDLRCRFANRNYLDWFGRAGEAMIGLTLPDLLGERVYRLNKKHIEAALAGQYQEFERTLTKPSGIAGHTLTRYIPHVDETGQPAGFFALVLDVTETKRAEAELRMLNEQLTAARDRADAASAAKSDSLATVSHEIRTPLNAILGMLHLLQHTSLDARQADFVAKSHAAAASLVGLVDSILDLSRIEAGKLTIEREPFSLDELLQGVASIAAANLGAKPVELLFDIDPSLPPTLIGDAMRLRQVLINLVSNAAKFTEQGEIIITATARMGADGSSQLVISVSDTGIGIAADRLPAIFEGFAQGEVSTSRRFGGAGLGLAICKRLVHLMEGEIEVRSQPGVGSMFTVAIPMSLSSPGEAGVRPGPFAGLRVLVVDGNPHVLRVLRQLAASLDWSVDEASSGARAIAMLGRLEAPCHDAILVDFGIDGRDGFETGLALRALPAGRAVPLIVMVGFDGREMLARRESVQPALLDAILLKPVTRAMLVEAVVRARTRRGGDGESAADGGAAAADGEAAADGAAAARRLAGCYLLLVDDERINREVAEALLTMQGARVVSAASAAEAITVLSGDRRFDAILMDVQMEPMDGYAATRAIRLRFGLPAIPVIALTANALESDQEAARAAGMVDYILKPYTPEGMAAVIERNLAHGRRTATSDRPDMSAGAPASPLPLTLPASEQPEDVLDLVGAVDALNGNWVLYRRILRAVRARVPVMIADLTRLLAEGDLGEARRVVHTLKTLAGMAGARTVRGLLDEAEVLSAVHLSGLLPVLVAASEAMIDAIEPFLEEEDATLTAADVVDDIGARDALDGDQAAPPDLDALSAEDLREGLLGLAERLNDGDMRAVTFIEALRRRHDGSLSSSLTSIEDMIRRFDFSSAIDLCYKTLAVINRGDPKG